MQDQPIQVTFTEISETDASVRKKKAHRTLALHRKPFDKNDGCPKEVIALIVENKIEVFNVGNAVFIFFDKTQNEISQLIYNKIRSHTSLILRNWADTKAT